MDITVKETSNRNRVKLVEEQFHMWEATGPHKKEQSPRAVSFITISRQYGCAGFRIGDCLAAVLNGLQQPESIGGSPWTVYDRKLVDRVCQDHKLKHTLVETLDHQRKNPLGDYITGLFTGEPSSLKVFKKCAQTIFELAAAGHVILIGRAASMVTARLAGGLHVRITGSLDWRVKQVAAFEKIDQPAEARKYVLKQDEEREKFARDFLGHSVSEPEHYDLILNQEKLGVERIVKLMLRVIELKRYEDLEA